MTFQRCCCWMLDGCRPFVRSVSSSSSSQQQHLPPTAPPTNQRTTTTTHSLTHSRHRCRHLIISINIVVVFVGWLVGWLVGRTRTVQQIQQIHPRPPQPAATASHDATRGLPFPRGERTQRPHHDVWEMNCSRISCLRDLKDTHTTKRLPQR